jgi:two-component system sensor histidine kinase HydH
MAPFEDARQEDIRNTVVISFVLVLLGFGGFLSLFWVQNYQTTRRLLQDTSAFATEVVANLPVGLIATGPDGNIAFLNEAAERITGHTIEAARGGTPDGILPEEWCGLKELLDKGEAILEKEIECSFVGGRSVPLSVSGTKIVNEEGSFVGHLLILRDLREVRGLQEEIRRQEKLAALGSMAAGIAHEIRNPLSSIKGLATLFGGQFDEGSEGKEAAGVMLREVDRLNRVISELLEFARPSDLKLNPVDINDLLEHSVRLVQQDAKTKDIETKLAKHGGLPLVALDPDRFSQAILNLYLNAIQAMDNGGVLSIETTLPDDLHVMVQVADTGDGIRAHDLGKIFDPYFTTKPTGTGLGLAIVHKIIESHRGKLRAESTPGKGTVFTILIPVSHDKTTEQGHYEA